MRLTKPTTSVLPSFIPKNPITKMIQEGFLEEKYSDIVFKVGGDQRKVNAKKVAKTTPVTFPAHRVIVAKFSNTLAELCASGGGDNGTNPIEIDNVSPDIFRLLLSYMYGMTISIDNMKSHAKEIIDVADRFGVTSLKLEAEANLVNITKLSVENVKDLLIYADSKNCALLKEVAMDYMLEHSDVVLQNIRFDDAPGSLVSDVFAAIARAKMRKDGRGATDANENSASHFHSMRISELRQRVHVDGSREMLIASLEKASTELNSLDEELEEEL
jgi:speckle-type POZ protein